MYDENQRLRVKKTTNKGMLCVSQFMKINTAAIHTIVSCTFLYWHKL